MYDHYDAGSASGPILRMTTTRLTRQGIHGLCIDQNIELREIPARPSADLLLRMSALATHLDQVTLLVSRGIIIKARITATSTLEIAKEIGRDIGKRKFVFQSCAV